MKEFIEFKNTDIGLLPNDWEAKKLGDLVEISSGESPSKFEFLSSGQGVPYYKVEQLNNGNIYTDYTPYWVESSKFVKSGSVVFPKRGASILSNKVRILKYNSLLDTNLMALTCNSLLDSNYLQMVLSYRGLDKVADTTSIPQINNKHIIPYVIPYPLIHEQQKIATALSDTDALISELEKLIEKKQAIKTATMQQLLTGKTRLPEFALREDGMPKGYKDSELGRIPEDWEVVCLGDIGQALIGLTYSPNDTAEFGTLVLRSSNVQNGKLSFDNNVFVRMALPDRVIVKEGDILICVRNGSRQLIGKCALIDKKTEGSAFGAFMSVYRTKSYGFIFYQFQSNIIQNQINETMGATINQITNKDLNSFRIMQPLIAKEKNEIYETIKDLDKDINLDIKRLNKLISIKQGMMQELLTGKTRLV